MSARAFSWLARSLCVFCVALLVSTAVLSIMSSTYAKESAGSWGTLNMIFIFPVVILSFALVGP